MRRTTHYYVPRHKRQGTTYKQHTKQRKREFFCKTKPSERLYYYIHLDAVAMCLQHSLQYAYCRALGQIWRQILGTPMGNHASSNTAGAFANSFDAPHEAVRADKETTNYGRYHDDKHAFVYSWAGHQQVPGLPPAMRENFYTSKCPMAITHDRKFCGLTVRCNQHLIAVQPDTQKGCLVHAESCISRKITRAIAYGCYARLSQTHNALGDYVYGSENVLRTTDKLLGLGYSLKTCMSAVRGFLPHHYQQVAPHYNVHA
jgi:hypothetical protein